MMVDVVILPPFDARGYYCIVAASSQIGVVVVVVVMG